jgi:hypothetical protein
MVNPKTTGSVADKEKEFRDHTWDHSSDPFQLRFDEPVPLAENALSALVSICKDLDESSDLQLSESVRQAILSKRLSFELLLQLCGLTRNKLVTDLRAASRARGTLSRSSPQAFVTTPESWKVAGVYLAPRLRKVLQPISHSPDLPQFLESLNQATWLGYIRQERAKRQGHEAEFRLAKLLQQCGIPFEPLDKAENPLVPDAQIHGISFDLVIPSIGRPSVCVKATVHTSNIGQYGESKDALEIAEARRMIRRIFRSEPMPILLAFVDGVGFESNRAGLRGLLKKSDEFCQFRTIWKAIVICCSKLNKPVSVFLPGEEIERYRDWFGRYNYLKLVHSLQNQMASAQMIQAGDAWLSLRF